MITDLGKVLEASFMAGVGWSVGTCMGSILRYFGRLVMQESEKR